MSEEEFRDKLLVILLDDLPTWEAVGRILELYREAQAKQSPPKVFPN